MQFPLETQFLVIDDMSSMRLFIKKTLSSIGYKKIREAPDGAAALKVLEEAHAEGDAVQAVLCDWNMPKMSGLELLAKVRGDDRFKHLPFVMITAENEIKNITAAIKSGVSNYIVKPFTADTLKQKLDQTAQKIAQDQGA